MFTVIESFVLMQKIHFPLDHVGERSMDSKAQVVANTLGSDYF